MTSAIGRRVAVFWPEEDEWYEGTVTVKGESPSRANDNTYNGVGYRIDYDDGDVGWVADFSTVRFLDGAVFTEEPHDDAHETAPRAAEEEVAVEDNHEEVDVDEAHVHADTEAAGPIEDSEDGGSPLLDRDFDEWGGVNLNEILEETWRQQSFLDEFDKRYGPGLSGPTSPAGNTAAAAAVASSAAFDDVGGDDDSDDSAFVALDLPVSRSNAFNASSSGDKEALPLESPLEAPNVGPLPAPEQRQPFYPDEGEGSDAYRTMLAVASAQVPVAVGSDAVLEDDDDDEADEIQERWAATRGEPAKPRNGPYVAGRTSSVKKDFSESQRGSGKSKAISSAAHGSTVTHKARNAAAVAAPPRRIASISGCASAVRFEIVGTVREVQRQRLRVRVLFMEPPPPPRTKTNRSASRGGNASTTGPRKNGLQNEGASLMLRAKATITTSNPAPAQSVASADGLGSERMEWRFDGDGSKKSGFAFEAEIPSGNGRTAPTNLGHLMFVAYEDLGARAPPSSSGSGGGIGGGLRFIGQAVVALAEVVATMTDEVNGWLPLTLRDGAPIRDMSGGFVALPSRNSTPQRYRSGAGNNRSSSASLEVTSAEVRMSVRVAISSDEPPVELKTTTSGCPKVSLTAPAGANRTAAPAAPSAAVKPSTSRTKSLTSARKRAEEERIAKSNVYLQRALGHADGPYALNKVPTTAQSKPSTNGTNAASSTGVKMTVNVDGPHGDGKSGNVAKNGVGAMQGDLLAQVEALTAENSAKASTVASLRTKALHGRVVASKNKQLLAQLTKALASVKQRTRGAEDRQEHRRLTLRAEAKGDDDDDAQSKSANGQYEDKLDDCDDESKVGNGRQRGIESGETEAQQIAGDPAMREFPIPPSLALDLSCSIGADAKVNASTNNNGGELESLEKRYASLWSTRASLVASIRKSREAFDGHRAARKASEAALEEANERKASDEAARRAFLSSDGRSHGNSRLLEQAGDDDTYHGLFRDERTSHHALTPLQAARRDLEHEKASLEARSHYYRTLLDSTGKDVNSGEVAELTAEADALRAKVKRKETKLALARRQLEEAKAQHSNLVASGGEQRLAAATQSLTRAAARLRAREEGRGAGAAWAEAEVRRLGHQTYAPLHNNLLHMSVFEGKSTDSDDESKAPHGDI